MDGWVLAIDCGEGRVSVALSAGTDPEVFDVGPVVAGAGNAGPETTSATASGLAHVLRAATERLGEVPVATVLAHPVDWSADDVDLLIEAANAAGLPAPSALPAPLAAAIHHAPDRTVVGVDESCAIVDRAAAAAVLAGGEALERATLVLRTADGFVVADAGPGVAGRLAAIYLVGAVGDITSTARIADLIAAGTGLVPEYDAEPETVVALGAARWLLGVPSISVPVLAGVGARKDAANGDQGDQETDGVYGQSASYQDPYGNPQQPTSGYPYGQPTSGQPNDPYGQPGYGQPQQPAYGQPPADPYGQPQQPAYGQPSAPPYGQPADPYAQPPADPYAQPADPYAQPPADPYAQPADPYANPTSGPAYGAPTSGPAYGTPTSSQPAYGQPAYGQTPYGQTPYGGGYPPGPPKKSGPKIGLILGGVAAVVIVLLVVVVVGVIAFTGNNKDDTANPTPSATATPTTPSDSLSSSAPPTDTPSTSGSGTFTSAALNSLAAGSTGISNCRSLTSDVPGVNEAMQCDGSVTNNVYFLQFSDASSMDTALTNAAKGVTGTGKCESGQEADTTWSYGASGATKGRLVCVNDDAGKFIIWWGYNDQNVLAGTSGTDAVGLAKWWTDNNFTIE